MADTDPDELERRIERTRAELARTVDAIADRVSPKRVAQRGVARVRANAEQIVSTVSARVGDIVGDIVSGPAVNGAEPARFTGEPRGTVPWHEQDRLREQVRELAPVLIGVGAVLAVGAAVALWRRRRR